ncbi:GGDEF domain-containing protein [Gallaecimonas kandeliae]|uniref:GGDEF domain-containing protein n=1 Tax=Gallaecimonas kandeliae TaxID=3029055 RepID=UPI002648AC92|nr:GGDEF domain-containing protein [Gallaecimonas kandeliae]WKE67116.1 GGDEF domain-containing protein [Gallaecimonas kandeliae]
MIKLLTPAQVVLRITAIIASVELTIMLVLGLVPHKLGIYLEAALDVTWLALLSSPLIYLWVIRPFVQARDEALAKVSHLAHVDPLTQLANRRLLAKCLERDMASSAGHSLHKALLLIDLDDFKPINDDHGHDAGDAVLVAVAQRLLASVRSEDVVSRLGGDEFVVFMQCSDTDRQRAQDKARLVAIKLIAAIQEPLTFNGKALVVGASIGIRLLGLERLDPETLIRDADLAMYKAKQAGRGCVAVFND